jgi:hypothetical protein
MSETGVCPKCNGTGKVPASAESIKYRAAGLKVNPDGTATTECTNCGGQTMSIKGTGKVPLRADGTPCMHEWNYRLAGRCYHEYTCKHCSSQYYIDSGD